MKKLLLLSLLTWTFQSNAQDSTEAGNKPVQIFSSEKAINAYTPETIGKGKMAFKVFHNFGDVAGKNGGIENFFGLDVSTDVKIGFDIGLSDKFNLVLSRSKGGIVQQLWEVGFKWKLMDQIENDPGHPMAIALFANTVLTTMRTGRTGPESQFHDFGERLSNCVQLILAKRFGDVSLQLNPTYVHRGFAVPYDTKNHFALGAAMRVPLVKNRLNLLADFFHVFRSDAVEDSFKLRQNVEFSDPLGVGLKS
jgi:hypothetical protein